IIAQALLGAIEAHSPTEADAAIAFVAESGGIFRRIGIASGSFGARVGHEKDHVLAMRHFDEIRRASDVIDPSVFRMIFDEWLAGSACLSPEDRMRNQ